MCHSAPSVRWRSYKRPVNGALLECLRVDRRLLLAFAMHTHLSKLRVLLVAAALAFGLAPRRAHACVSGRAECAGKQEGQACADYPSNTTVIGYCGVTTVSCGCPIMSCIGTPVCDGSEHAKAAISACDPSAEDSDSGTSIDIDGGKDASLAGEGRACEVGGAPGTCRAVACGDSGTVLACGLRMPEGYVKRFTPTCQQDMGGGLPAESGCSIESGGTANPALGASLLALIATGVHRYRRRRRGPNGQAH